MKKQQCKDGLEIYKKYLVRMEKIQSFLKVAENVSQSHFNTAQYMVRTSCGDLRFSIWCSRDFLFKNLLIKKVVLILEKDCKGLY